MGTSYLIDTNAIIDLIGNTLPLNGAQWLLSVVNANDHALSVINRIEVLSFVANPTTNLITERFVNNSSIIPLDEDIIQRTIAIRHAVKIKLPDAIIAATALVFDLVLVTRNVIDFKRIPGIKLLDPHTL